MQLPEGKDLSALIIGDGFGWADREHQYGRRSQYEALEDEARRRRLGVWKPLPEPQGSQSVLVIKGSLSYHPPDCAHIKKTQTESMTLNAAKAAGYRPCAKFRSPG